MNGRDISTKTQFRSINQSLHPTGRMPSIILQFWGFLSVRDAGHRGNKITGRCQYLFMLIQKNLKYWPFLSLRCQRSTNVTNSPWKDCCHLSIKFISPIIYVFSKKESSLKKSYRIFFVTTLSRTFLFLKDHPRLLLAS